MNTHGATVNRGEIVSMYAGLKGNQVLGMIRRNITYKEKI